MSVAGGRVLVIHPGALGDVLQAVPALRALGDGARVTFCGQPRLGEVLAGAGVVADAAVVRRLRPRDPVHGRAGVPGADRPARRLRARRLLVRLSRRALRRAPPRAGAFMRGGPPAARGRWRSRCGSTCSRRWAGCRAPDPRSLRTAGAPRRLARPRPAARSTRSACAGTEPLLVVQPGAGSQWKVAPADLLARVIAPVVSGGDVQVLAARGAGRRGGRGRARPRRRIADAHAGVAAAARPGRRPVNGAAPISAGTPGVSHLAAAVGAPAVILFPAATWKRWAPWSPTARPILMEPGAAAGFRVAAGAAAALGEAISAWR